ncbi:MAG: DMT family transporter [Alphaproteobacteria bacterium]|nr:DMT family transporter [Alphaproteobacteria bacterium]
MPFVYMMLAVLSWSLFPLTGVWGTERIGIFDFILWAYVAGFAASGAVYLMMPARKRAALPPLGLQSGKTAAVLVLAWVAAILSFFCLLRSFSYMPRAAATIAFEIWLILAIYVSPLLMKRGWDTISLRDKMFSLLAVAGVLFLLAPLAPQLSLFRLLLPVIGGCCMTVASVIKPQIARRLENRDYPLASLLRIQTLFCGGTALLAVPFACLWPDKQSFYDARGVAAILFAGTVIFTLGNVFYTLAMLRAQKGNILALWSLKPVLAVLWLWLAGQTGITPLIVLGGIFIIASGMMISVKADQSQSYAATVVCLILCGAYAYFFKGLGMDDYYQAISVPLFFYAILVAFMMDRLIKSDELEERLAIETMNHVAAAAGEIGPAAEACRAHIYGIITTNDIAEVDAHYRAVRNDGNPRLAAIHDRLDQLVLSKVRGTNFSEMFVIFIVGALTVLSSMVYRPDTLIADGFAIVVPLSVVFIFFTLIDLVDKRRRFYLAAGRDGQMGLAREVTQDLFGERLIAAALIVVVLAAFAVLLITKHALP